MTGSDHTASFGSAHCSTNDNPPPLLVCEAPAAPNAPPSPPLLRPRSRLRRSIRRLVRPRPRSVLSFRAVTRAATRNHHLLLLPRSPRPLRRAQRLERKSASVEGTGPTVHD